MPDPEQPSEPESNNEDSDRTLAMHLLRQPHDLIDARKLLHRYGVSPREFQRALLLLDKKDGLLTDTE